MRPPLWDWTDMLCFLTIYTFIDVNVFKNPTQLVKVELKKNRKRVHSLLVSIFHRLGVRHPYFHCEARTVATLHLGGFKSAPPESEYVMMMRLKPVDCRGQGVW